LIAINYSIIEGDTVYDYICYRNPLLSDHSLGIFAILENIKYVQKRYPECKYYDLASEFDYKRKFVNREKYHAVCDLVPVYSLRTFDINKKAHGHHGN
jgi:arginyl-tRNA--protein-N-Asp/Glu arginylyltransferase